MLPRPMVPRGRPNGLSSLCCRVPCCRAVLHVAASHGAAQFYMLPRPMVPRSSLCFRVPWCRAVLHVAAFHAAALRSTCGRASVLSAAQFYVPPRSMPPRSSLCCRVPCCRAVPCVAASHGAAQFYMLPRPLLPRYVLRAAAPRSLVPRSLRVAALHGAARGTTLRVLALLPRGGLDCYKRAARSIVGVSRSTAVVEVGRRRIVWSTVGLQSSSERSCGYSIFDVVS